MTERPDITIRQIKSSDLPEVRRVAALVFNKHDCFVAINDISYHLRLRDRKIEDGKRFWIGSTNGKIVGFIGTEETPKKVIWLSWFGVKKGFRRSGFGGKLFEHALKMAKRAKTRSFFVETGSLPIFAAANKLYRKYGFKKRMRVADFWDKGDDLILLSRSAL